MKTTLYNIIPALLLLFCLLTAVGCGEFVEEETAVALTFSEVDMKETTRASSMLNSATMSNFGIYAGYNKGNSTFGGLSAGTNYMRNARVTKDWTANTWNTDVPYYWPSKTNWKVSFFAYAPYMNDETQLKLDPAYTTGAPTLLFTPKTEPQYQVDFCVATPLFDQTEDNNPLTFHFDHTLTFIKFFANYQGTLPSESGFEYIIKIDRLTLHHIVGTKGITFKKVSPYYEWGADNDTYDTDYTLSRQSEELTDSEIPSNVAVGGVVPYRELEWQRGMLFLLPQTINESTQSDKSTLEIDFSFVRRSSTSQETLSQFNVVKELPAGTVWEPCGIVKYYFTLNVENLSSVKISATSSTWIDDWADSGNTDPNETIEK